MRRGRKRYKERRESERGGGGSREMRNREREKTGNLFVCALLCWMEMRWVKLKKN